MASPRHHKDMMDSVLHADLSGGQMCKPNGRQQQVEAARSKGRPRDKQRAAAAA